MKLIRSLAEQQKNKYVRGLEQENAELRMQVAKYETMLKIKRHPLHPLLIPEKTTPTYARSTESSSRHSKTAIEEDGTGVTKTAERVDARRTREPDPFTWIDGKLVDTSHNGDLSKLSLWDVDCPGFLGHTLATANRKIPSREDSRIITSPDTNSPGKVRIISSYRQKTSTYSIYLAQKTRLDNIPKSRENECIIIPHRDQTAILERALKLAQCTVFDACQEYSPDLQMCRYPLGPSMVKFGRDELLGTFAHSCHGGICNWRQTDINQDHVYDAIFDMVGLRNAVGHPRIHTTKQIDAMLRIVQNLAITLHDRHHAEKARALRDELEERSEQVHQQIKFMRALPFAPEWEMHVKALFRDVEWDDMCAPGAIVRAAREWKVGDLHGGKADEEYISRCKILPWRGDGLC